MLLATKTLPFATTGTIFELPPVLGQVPALAVKSCVMVLPPASGSKANRFTLLEVLETGRETAQMIGLAVPFEEMVVKNPPSCPPPIDGDVVIFVNDGVGEVCSC